MIVECLCLFDMMIKMNDVKGRYYAGFVNIARFSPEV